MQRVSVIAGVDGDQRAWCACREAAALSRIEARLQEWQKIQAQAHEDGQSNPALVQLGQRIARLNAAIKCACVCSLVTPVNQYPELHVGVMDLRHEDGKRSGDLPVSCSCKCEAACHPPPDVDDFYPPTSHLLSQHAMFVTLPYSFSVSAFRRPEGLRSVLVNCYFSMPAQYGVLLQGHHSEQHRSSCSWQVCSSQ